MAIDGERNDSVIHPHSDNAEETTKKWQHIAVMAQDMEKELKGLQSYYWVSQMKKLHDRAVFEARKSQGVDGDRVRLWWQNKESRIE